VTPWRSIRSVSTAGSATAEKTRLAPTIAVPQGMPQQAAWNIGTTGNMTERLSSAKICG
jgi:hypothetical protein